MGLEMFVKIGQSIKIRTHYIENLFFSYHILLTRSNLCKRCIDATGVCFL